MEKWEDMFVNGCNMVYCGSERERNDFVKRFLDKNREYTFQMHAEFMDLKKRLFGNPSVFKIYTDNKTIKKTKSTEEIVELLKLLSIYHLADRVPRAMSFGQRMMCSVAYDLLEKDEATFLISEGGSYNKETLKWIADCVHFYAQMSEVKFVWVTDTAHQDTEVLELCDGLFELKEGKLIQHDAKKVGGLFISKDHMPLLGKVCLLNDGTEGIVIGKQYGPIRGSECYEFSIRELETGEVSKLTVMWTRKAENPTYYSFYKSSYPREGAKASKLGDFVCWYEQEMRNVEYESYEADLRYCTYMGNHLCRDLFTGETYRPDVNDVVQKELDLVKTGDIVSVCLYRGKAYFGGSYRTETLVALFASDKNGVLRYYDASNYGFIHTDQVYAEKDGKLVDISSEEDKLYILHRMHMLEVKNSEMYVRRGFESPLAWVTPAEGEIKYGVLKGNMDENRKVKTLTFTPFSEECSYLVNKNTFSEGSLELLCEKAIPIKAELFEVDYKLAVPSEKLLERHILTYTFQDGDNAVCVDTDTYELTEIPCADLPAEITEGCIFEYYPEVKYFALVERVYSNDEVEDEPVAESIVTYEGFDTAKQAHVIRIVDGDGKMAEYTYENEEIEFVEDGIEKGMRVDMRLSFNDDTCSLNVHLSKYRG